MALALTGSMELRMRQSPSMIPTDRLDRDIYLVRQGSGLRTRGVEPDRALAYGCVDVRSPYARG
jgi:hypothetical protein